jgi:hypothetical protein
MANDECQLTPAYMDFLGFHSPISGILNDYKLIQPLEVNRRALMPGELEPD